jgi:mannose-6-phosphate isomerase-like protein (cupin superfamily)
MKYSRRDFGLLLPALASTCLRAQDSAEQQGSRGFPLEQLRTEVDGTSKGRALLNGETRAGCPLEVHLMELAAGEASHSPHRHLHEEMFLLQAGILVATVNEKVTRLTPGSVLYVKSNESHSVRNPGPDPAQYFIVGLGQDAAAALRSESAQELELDLRDYATMPMTGSVDGKGEVKCLLARVNFVREEPGSHGKKRFFVNDLNGPLYILDKISGEFTTYLNFNGRDGRPGLFHKLPTDEGFANGFISFAFDPDYAHNGKFYTIHLEDPELPGSAMPDNIHFPGVDTSGYKLTPAIETPGATIREAVLLEWRDTNTQNATFEGTVRELMRLKHNTRIHPMGDLIFNPTAHRGDPDWRVLYVACGDGGAGESSNPEKRSNPQRLDTLVGKILRIIPDLNERKGSSTVSENGRYRVPNDNPFVGKPGARGEIWAYGLRNPARLTWDFDPANPGSNHLIASVIGLNTWETVVIIHKGANYGYSLREGNQKLETTNRTSDLPEDDRIPVRINATEVDGTVTPTYPVIQYGHVKGGGDAVSSGQVYRGKAIPALRGKYIFGDISTGHLWWVDYKEMLAADDGDPGTLAAMHPLKIRWTQPGAASEVYSSMAPIAEWAYHARGGTAVGLPGKAIVAERGRADIHLWEDSDGQLYILSKSDGMIRIVTGATDPGSGQADSGLRGRMA